MPARKHVIRGISEVGARRAGADVSFGKTTPDGASIAYQTSQVDVESGQSTFLEDIFTNSSRVDVTFRLLFANLVTMKDVLGLADAQLTGDLAGGVPTAEVLIIPNEGMGNRVDSLYIVTPGPLGTRRYDLHRCKPRGNLSIDMSRDRHIVVEGTWAVLRADTDAAGVAVTGPMTIKDNL